MRLMETKMGWMEKKEWKLSIYVYKNKLNVSEKKSAVGLQIAVWLHESPRFSCQILYNLILFYIL
jgi:hypothetical protein